MSETTKEATLEHTGRSWTEAPASLTIKYFTEDGFDMMLTMRGENGVEVLEKSEAALTWLRQSGARPHYAPVPTNNGAQTEVAAGPAPTLANGSPDPAWCSIHGVAMKRRESNGDVWYSHKVGSEWCRGE